MVNFSRSSALASSKSHVTTSVDHTHRRPIPYRTCPASNQLPSALSPSLPTIQTEGVPPGESSSLIEDAMSTIQETKDSFQHRPDNMAPSMIPRGREGAEREALTLSRLASLHARLKTAQLRVHAQKLQWDAVVRDVEIMEQVHTHLYILQTVYVNDVKTHINIILADHTSLRDEYYERSLDSLAYRTSTSLLSLFLALCPFIVSLSFRWWRVRCRCLTSWRGTPRPSPVADSPPHSTTSPRPSHGTTID